jgi:hypothetical protein
VTTAHSPGTAFRLPRYLRVHWARVLTCADLKIVVAHALAEVLAPAAESPFLRKPEKLA